MGVAYGTAVGVVLVAMAVCAWLVSIACTTAAIAYARRRGLLDQPGKRRSHRVPTPRGGGVGIVAAVLLAGLPAWRMLDRTVSAWTLAAMAIAVAAVALVGWRDDHSPLPVLPRIAVHAGAALLVALAVLVPWLPHAPRLAWLLVPLVPVLVGFVNAHNFMDGIDGILALQGLFVMLGLGLLALWLGGAGLAGLAFASAAGCLGFLLFNHPPARVFMGDVGSGALGLVIGAVAALLVQRQPAILWACATLPSAFLVDSGLTLARRMLAGQRWYAPHRQHLYQWLVRVNWSHAQTDAAYVTWNLLIVAPLAWLAAIQPMLGAWYCAAAYVAGVVVWLASKRACLASVRKGRVHESA